MSANRLIASQRVKAALDSLFNTVPSFQPAIRQIRVDDPDNEDKDWCDAVSFQHTTNTLFYNREWVACQEDAQLRFAVATIVVQLLMDHASRRDDRDIRQWSVASNYAAVATVMGLGLKNIEPPANTLYNPNFAGWTAEEIYEQILTDPYDLPSLRTKEEVEHARARLREAAEACDPENDLEANFKAAILKATAKKPEHRNVTKVAVETMVAGDEVSYYVQVYNNVGQTYTAAHHVDLDHALIEAQDVADFFGIDPMPFYIGDELVKPSMTLDTYKD